MSTHNSNFQQQQQQQQQKEEEEEIQLEIIKPVHINVVGQLETLLPEIKTELPPHRWAGDVTTHLVTSQPPSISFSVSAAETITYNSILVIFSVCLYFN